MSVPISLSYHASGIKVQQKASSVGLGWSLNAGGAITRVMRGLPDDVKDGYINTQQNLENVWTDLQGPVVFGCTDPTSDYCIYKANLIGNGFPSTRFVDPQPDIFMFNFGGYSGKFVVGSGEIRTIPHQMLKVTPLHDPSRIDANGNPDDENDGSIIGWEVVALDGTIYTFEAIEETSQLSGIPRYYASAWYLTSIKSAVGDEEITFTYSTPVTYDGFIDALDKSSEQRWYYLNGVTSQPGPSLGPNNVNKEERYLEGITTDKGYVTFSTDVRSDQPDYEYRKRQTGFTVFAPNGQRLQRVSFVQGYFNQGDSIPSGVLGGSDLRGEVMERLRLEEVVIYGNTDQAEQPPYKFSYYGYDTGDTDPSYKLPPTTSLAEDRWGFYNGKTINDDNAHLFIPSFSWTSEENSSFTVQYPDPTHGLPDPADRSVDATGLYMQVASLKQITYPTGGHTKFEYEPHQYSVIGEAVEETLTPSVRTAGGLRIKKITTHDGLNPSKDIVKTYTYDGSKLDELRGFSEPTDVSSGVLVYEPRFLHYGIGDTGRLFLFAYSSDLVTAGTGTHIGYRQVSVQQSGAGEEVHFYLTASGEYHAAGYRAAHDILPDRLTNRVYTTNYDWKRGAHLLSIVYNDDDPGKKITSTKNEYYFADTEIVSLTEKIPALNYETICLYDTPDCSTGRDVADYETFEIISSVLLPKVKTETTYSEDNQAVKVEKVTTYTYDQLDVHLQPTVVTETDADGRQRISTYTYAAERAEYAGMKAANMLVQQYSSGVSESTSGTSGSTPESKQWTCWDDQWSDGTFWRTETIYAWDGTGDPVTADPCSSNGVNAHKLGEITGYTDYGQITALQDASGTSYTYTYHPQYRFVEQFSRGGLTTHYRYTATDHRWGLVDEIEDENGRKTRYDYDEFRRLKEIRNNASNGGEAISQIDYHYSSGDLSLDLNRITTTAINDTSVVTEAYLDGLGRTIESRVKETNGEIVTVTSYDALGRQESVTKPFRVPVGAAPKAPEDAASYYTGISDGVSGGSANAYYCENGSLASSPLIITEYLPDPTARVEKEIMPFCDGQTQSTASALVYDYDVESPRVTTSTTDENGQVAKAFTDGFGQVVKSIAAFGSDDVATTEFSYDVRGNLVSVTSPEDLQTSYTYNALGQLTQKSTPDIVGTYNYRYDANGNLRFVQDPNGDITYTKYDALNRMVESGLYTGSVSFTLLNPDTPTEPASDTDQVRSYQYTLGELDQVTFEAGEGGSYAYTYDTEGRMESMTICLDDLEEGTSPACPVLTYYYDLQGNVTKTILSPAIQDGFLFYHWYNYDAAGRLIRVYTGTSDNLDLRRMEAEYAYTATGQVRQLKLGEDDQGAPLQNIFYRYHVRDWLTHINDVEQLGTERFAMHLGYTDTPPMDGYGTQANGNVSWLQWRTHGNSDIGTYTSDTDADIGGYAFMYDDLNRLERANFSYKDQGSVPWTTTNAFDVGVSNAIEYDLNGNIIKLPRANEAGTNNSQLLTYTYTPNTNRLASIGTGGDLEAFVYDNNGNMTQGRLGMTFDYTHYNLPRETVIPVADAGCPGENHSFFRYDASGQRVYKRTDFVADQPDGQSCVNVTGTETFYIRGADGTVLAVYAVPVGADPELRHLNILAGGSILGRVEVPNPPNP